MVSHGQRPYVAPPKVLYPTEVLPPPWVIEVGQDDRITFIRFPGDDPVLFKAIFDLQQIMRARDYDTVTVRQA